MPDALRRSCDGNQINNYIIPEKLTNKRQDNEGQNKRNEDSNEVNVGLFTLLSLR